MTPEETKALVIHFISCRQCSRPWGPRVTGMFINTVTKLLVDPGRACANHHHEHVRNVEAKRVQYDETWRFVYAKLKNVERVTSAPRGAGNVWTWTDIDADSKLIIAYVLGGRDGGYASYRTCRRCASADAALYAGDGGGDRHHGSRHGLNRGADRGG